MRDRFLSEYIGRIKEECAQQKEALVRNPHHDLYSVGVLQGQVQGLEKALSALEDTINEHDV